VKNNIILIIITSLTYWSSKSKELCDTKSISYYYYIQASSKTIVCMHHTFYDYVNMIILIYQIYTTYYSARSIV